MFPWLLLCSVENEVEFSHLPTSKMFPCRAVTVVCIVGWVLDFFVYVNVNIFISNMDGGVECYLSNFDTKL